jgi:hypothetical protein
MNTGHDHNRDPLEEDEHPDHHEDLDHVHGHRENPWAGQGAVLLDIGGDIGALVVKMPPEMMDVEVEIRQTQGGAGATRHHPHVAVVARRVGTKTVPSLVYPELRTGSYDLYEKGTDLVQMTAHVKGGSVTQATWPAPPPEPDAKVKSAGPDGTA